VDCKKERIAVAEAKKLGIPIIGIVDTNSDPDPIDFPIAGNDDAIKSIRVITRQVVDSAIDARSLVLDREGALTKADDDLEGVTPKVVDAGSRTAER
jgi:small subunit ribosomal protein S2